LDDLLYGQNRSINRHKIEVYDEPWNRPIETLENASYRPPVLSHSQSGFNPQQSLGLSSANPVPASRSRSAKNQIRKNHSLSPHRPNIATSTLIKGLQSEFAHDLRGQGENSNSTGKSSSSDKSYNSNSLGNRNQVEILDQCDYYRSSMTRNEAEKVIIVMSLDNVSIIFLK
jgi:hypothetical protein